MPKESIKDSKTGKSIRTQIMSGFLRVSMLTVILAVTMIISLLWIRSDYSVVKKNQDNRNQIQTAITGHYEWLEKLNVSIQSGAEFTGSIDSKTCALGKWKSSVTKSDITDPVMKAAVEAGDGPHEKMHNMVTEITEISKSDKEAGYQLYLNDIKPQTNEVIKQLGIIDECYARDITKATSILISLITFAVLVTVILTAVITIFSVRYAKRIAVRISTPIEIVCEWANKLSLGIEELDFDEAALGSVRITEVNSLILAFRVMAKSIQDNVNVIQRVARGDMTAFVNIRSSKDSLGKNLYRMVQSNDILFNGIIQIAHTVAAGSDEIAKASQTLAESASVQASSVQSLSATIEHASGLIGQNKDKSSMALENTLKIQTVAMDSNERLSQLVQSVENMRTASHRISNVIKTIEDIAFQTNILALNAAVEAARAGESGKGFAVVADEVRNLANKSGDAAKESKTLIEDTIHRTQESGATALEVSETFSVIIEEVNKIVEIIRGVAASSQEQFSGIQEVNRQIALISDAASSNAAVSEQSAASSEEMSGNADLLRKAMGNFNLRKREQGQAYIPPEKQNDNEFVQYANKAYYKAQETGRHDEVYIDPERMKMET